MVSSYNGVRMWPLKCTTVVLPVTDINYRGQNISIVDLKTFKSHCLTLNGQIIGKCNRNLTQYTCNDESIGKIG